MPGIDAMKKLNSRTKSFSKNFYAFSTVISFKGVKKQFISAKELGATQTDSKNKCQITFDKAFQKLTTFFS